MKLLPQTPIRSTLSVVEISERFCREEKRLKDAGAFAEAAGVRDALVLVFRMADEEERAPHPLDPSDPP
jgi:hypothetical protein